MSVVAGIAPYADVRTVLEIATTGAYRHDDGRVEQFETTSWLQTTLARSLFDATDGPTEAEALERRLLRRDRPVDAAHELLGSEVRGRDPGGVLALLRSKHAAEFDERYEDLPASVRSRMQRLSPIRSIDELDVRIELASAPRDRCFPTSESRALVRAAPDAKLTITSTLEHAIPEASLDELGDLVAFNAFVVRVLREATR